MELDDESEVNAVLFSLWYKAMVDIAFDDDGDLMIALTDASYDEKQQKMLDEEELEVLLDIISAWNEID